MNLTIKKLGKINRILVTGASGQLGKSLGPVMQTIYGKENVLLTDLNTNNNCDILPLDVLIPNFRSETRSRSASTYRISVLIRWWTWLRYCQPRGRTTLSCATTSMWRDSKTSVTSQSNTNWPCTTNWFRFSPSTIAAFGPTTPKMDTPNVTIQKPTTMYGCTKTFSELLGCYYQKKYGLDFRSLRYP